MGLWESVFGFSENFFFENSFQCICQFHDVWFTSAPAHTCWVFSFLIFSFLLLFLSVQFFTKNGMPPVPHPLYLPDLSPRDFFSFPDEKNILKGEHFANVERWNNNKKMVKALKGLKIDEFKNCFEQWKNVLVGKMSNTEYFEGDWSLNMWEKNTQFFINKFWAFWVPPCIQKKVYRKIQIISVHLNECSQNDI